MKKLLANATAMGLLALSASCSGGAPSTPPATAGSASTAPSLTTPVASLATAPPELQGAWRATISTGEEATLTLRPKGYSVRRSLGGTGNGWIRVDGNRVVFSSTICELGSGLYEWSIQDETLVFTPLEPRDPCGGRIIFLEGASYTRVE